MVSTLAMTDALSKLLIKKGVITDEEFKKKLGEERAARSQLRGQNPQASQGRRYACRAAYQVRAGDQSEDSEAAWRDDSAVDTLSGGQGDQVI
jgi:hypothetical protein